MTNDTPNASTPDEKSNASTTKALWGERFSSAPDDAMRRFSTSLPIDARLWRFDIQGSLAHLHGLARARVLPQQEAEQIENGLHSIFADLEGGTLDFSNAPDEDIHSFVERILTERIGSVAGKLHSGRSRNDQIALDVRLYLKDALKQTQAEVRALQEVFLKRAEEFLGAPQNDTASHDNAITQNDAAHNGAAVRNDAASPDAILQGMTPIDADASDVNASDVNASEITSNDSASNALTSNVSNSRDAISDNASSDSSALDSSRDDEMPPHEYSGAILPGYTHLQRAQPVLLSHHLLAYFWMLSRDLERLSEIARRADVLPLGAAALAGTTFPIDRHLVAQELGFSRVSENSMDTVSDRDHMIESVSALAMIALHLSRLAEEIVLWSTPEWGFVRVDDRFATGSSIMPQKKNPDSMELIRGKSARVVGDLTTLLTLVKALPLTYNRDLQEDKEPLFDAFDTVTASLQIARGVLETLTFHTQKMRAAAGGGFSTATDVADWLVGQGVPFREAHHVVGHVVNFCESNQKELTDLSWDEWRQLDARFSTDVMRVVQVESSVAARDSFGGTAPRRVREQWLRARKEWQVGT